MLDVDTESNSNTGDDVCRDYMRNVCSRGRKCRFKHPMKAQPSFPNDTNGAKEERQKLVRMFCHDFQNTICSRDECKYIHCSKDDQECFMSSGFLQSLVLEDAISKSIIPSLPTEIPVCKDYLGGECRRGKACRYRHLSHSKYKKEINTLFGAECDEYLFDGCEKESDCKRFKLSCHPCGGDLSCLPITNGPLLQGYFPHDKCQIHMRCLYYNAEGCVMNPGPNLNPDSCHYEHFSNTMCDRNRINTQESHLDRSLQEENIFLRKRVEEFKRQLTDLAAANEFLLEQNAQLRIGRKNNNVSAVTPVSVTVTGTPVLSQIPGPPTTGQLVTGTPVISQIPTQTSTVVAVSGQNASGQQLVTATVPVSLAPGSLTAGVNPTAQQLVSGVSAPGQQIISTGTLNTVTVAGPTSTGQLVAAAVPVSCNATGQIMAAVSTVTVAGQTATTQQLVPVSCTATGQQQLVATAVPVSCTGQLVATGTLTVAGQTTQQQQLVSTQQLVPVSLATALPVPVSISAVSLPPTQQNNNQPNSIPIAITARATQPLVSYPIRTHLTQ